MRETAVEKDRPWQVANTLKQLTTVGVVGNFFKVGGFAHRAVW